MMFLLLGNDLFVLHVAYDILRERRIDIINVFSDLHVVSCCFLVLLFCHAAVLFRLISLSNFISPHENTQ